MPKIPISFSVGSMKTVKEINELMKYHFFIPSDYEWFILNLVATNPITLEEILTLLQFFKDRKSRLTGHPASFFKFILNKINRGYSMDGIIDLYLEYIKMPL